MQAISACEMAVISFDADSAISRSIPEWSEMTSQLLLETSMDFAEQKDLLSLNASQRYDFFIKKFPEIVNRVPLHYVASYLGIRQPSLSRIRKHIRL